MKKTILFIFEKTVCFRTHLRAHTLTHKNIPQKTSSNQSLTYRYNALFSTVTNCGYSDNAFYSKVKLNQCGLVNLKIIFLSVTNLIKSLLILANKSIYPFVCLLNSSLRIRLVFILFLDVRGNLEISNYTRLVSGIHITSRFLLSTNFTGSRDLICIIVSNSFLEAANRGVPSRMRC